MRITMPSQWSRWWWRPLYCCWLCILVAGARGQEEGGGDIVAALGYGTFRGAYSPTYNISYWQKIPFAAPPTGANRFRAPQAPLPVTGGTYDSSQRFDMCPQRTVNGSEDCLYLGLYSRPWRRGQPLRPVVVVFYGGGFIQGSASFGLPPAGYPVLNVSSSDAGLVFVYPNYRVNAFGFLPGREVAEDPGSDLNAGLLDQDFALRWVRDHVAAFGGDPGQVSIWGQSAGGGSVLAQVIARHDKVPLPGAGANETRRPPLFRRALASSPFWPRTPAHDGAEAQWRFDTLADRAGCRRGTGAATLACLKAADVQALREASLTVAGARTYSTSSYGWGPVVDGSFLARPLSEVTAPFFSAAASSSSVGEKEEGDSPLGTVESAFAMYNTHEGENFVPPGLGGGSSSDDGGGFNASTASFDAWLVGFLPGLSSADLRRVREAYPEAAAPGTETLARYDAPLARAGLVYRDAVLACPAYWMAGSAGAGGGWLGEYSIDPAKHASDTYWWNQVNPAQQTDPLHYRGYAGAFASFFATGDPDARKLTDAATPGVPPLRSGREFNVNARGFAQVQLTLLPRRCALWRELAPRVPL